LPRREGVIARCRRPRSALLNENQSAIDRCHCEERSDAASPMRMRMVMEIATYALVCWTRGSLGSYQENRSQGRPICHRELVPAGGRPSWMNIEVASSRSLAMTPDDGTSVFIQPARYNYVKVMNPRSRRFGGFFTTAPPNNSCPGSALAKHSERSAFPLYHHRARRPTTIQRSSLASRRSAVQARQRHNAEWIP
jgi:hypothetical protein